MNDTHCLNEEKNLTAKNLDQAKEKKGNAVYKGYVAVSAGFLDNDKDRQEAINDYNK